MREVFETPKDKQFVVIWSYNNLLWSGTFRYEDDLLERYSADADKWESSEGLYPWEEPDCEIEYRVYVRK